MSCTLACFFLVIHLQFIYGKITLCWKLYNFPLKNFVEIGIPLTYLFDHIKHEIALDLCMRPTFSLKRNV